MTSVSRALIALVTLLILWRFKIPEPALIVAAAIAGIVLYRG